MDHEFEGWSDGDETPSIACPLHSGAIRWHLDSLAERPSSLLTACLASGGGIHGFMLKTRLVVVIISAFSGSVINE